MDKSWIHGENRISARYLQGVVKFIDFALKYSKGGNIAWPCVKCVYSGHYAQNIVIEHPLNHGSSPSCTHWYFHGESSSTT